VSRWPEALADLVEDITAACGGAFADTTLRLVEVVPAPGGHSGFTYLVRLEGGTVDRQAVVRVPPPKARPSGSADVVRQGRIMAALGAAGLPVPAILAVADGGQTASGRPFVVMEMVVADPVDLASRTLAPERLLRAAVDVLHRIAALPEGLTGLEQDPSSSPAGQVDRWEILMRRGPAELTEGAGALAAALRASAPPAGRIGLVHGDYHFANLLFRNGEVAAVLDWEIAQLGPPEIDIACLAVSAIRRRFPADPNPGGQPAIKLDEVMSAAGPDYTNLEWHVASGCYKYAAIMAYNLDLHRRGRRVDPVYEQLTETIRSLIAQGAHLIR
jgi:aminoglycoside phosphotransferase (APT) family kinase protein